MGPVMLKRGWTLIALLLLLGGLIFSVPQPVSAAISVDGWGTQTSGTTVTLYSIWGASPTDIFACGEVGTVLRCNGLSWTPMSSGVTAALYGIWGSATDNVFAVGQNGCVINYDGSSWNTMTSGTLRHLNAVWGNSSSDVYAVGNSGTVIHFDGSTWNPVSPGVTTHLRGVWASSATDVFVVGDGGLILHYDGSSTWTTMASGSQPKFAAVWGTSSNNVFAVGDSGTIMHYDGSLPWDTMTSGVGANLCGVWGPGEDEVFAVGANSRILRYTNGSWNLMASGVTSDLYCVRGFSPINVYAAGSNGVILHYKEPAPIITSVTPNQVNQGEGLAITISGTNFLEATSIDLGSGINVIGWNIDSNFQITANATVYTSAVTGPRDVSVTNPYGTGTLTAGLLIPYPVVTGTAPATGNQGEAMTITISGSNLGATSAVSFGLDISIDSLLVKSPATVTVNISIAAAADAGPREVLVMSTGHVATWSSFAIPAATGSGVAPASGCQGETLDVAITGNNLFGTTEVDFGDNVTVDRFDIVSPTQIRANIAIDASATLGARTVSIVTPAGTATIPDAFNILSAPPPRPSVASVSPATGFQGQTLDLVVTGANLNGTTSISLGDGITINNLTVDSPTRLTANVTVSDTAAAGLRCASVTAASGTATLEDCFTVAIPVPQVVSLNLASAKPGETVEVVITGTRLDGATLVSLGDGITVNSFTIDSPTQITASITIDEDADSGPRDVLVTTPGGTDSLSAGFQIETQSEGTPFWAWILISLVPLLLILFFILSRRRKAEEERT